MFCLEHPINFLTPFFFKVFYADVYKNLNFSLTFFISVLHSSLDVT